MVFVYVSLDVGLGFRMSVGNHRLTSTFHASYIVLVVVHETNGVRSQDIVTKRCGCIVGTTKNTVIKHRFSH